MKFGARGEGAFQKTVVWLVTDDAQFGQRVTHSAALDDFSDEFRLVTQYVRIFLENSGADPRLNQAGPRQLKDECGRVVLAGKRGELQNAGVKNDSQDTAWRDAEPAHVVWLRRTEPHLVRSSSCHGFRDVPVPMLRRA